MKLIYVANIRIPTEKAHGLQIMQNCEALADHGVDVQLWVTRRINTTEMNAIADPFVHYGVKQNFLLRRLACLDLLPLVPNRTDAIAKAIFGLQYATFALAVLIVALFSARDAIFYSRDPLVLLVLSVIKRRDQRAYEAHTRLSGKIGGRIQKIVLRRVGHVFAVTRKLAQDLIAAGADVNHTHVAHDGVRAERFANMPSRKEARDRLGWDQALFVVGYVGRLHTMAMDKGVGTLVEALAKVGGCSIVLVGGPDDMAADLRARWIALGQDTARFLYAGQVAAGDVPIYLAAFDACAMPFPYTPHFAYYMSPLKLFEYMAAKRPILASDLPSIREVLTDGETGLLTPPSDADALAAAITQLRDDAPLRNRLADNAYRVVMAHYTWESRARMIIAALTTS